MTRGQPAAWPSRSLAIATVACVLAAAACGDPSLPVVDGEGQSGSGESGEPGETPWTVAVERANDDASGTRVWLIGADGSDPRPIPELPDDPPDAQRYVGWTADGEGLYVEVDGALRFYGDYRVEPVTCPAFETWGGSPDCMSHVDETFVLASGALVTARNLGASHIPGSHPIPEAYISIVDPRAGQAEIVAQTHHYTCVGVGEGPIILATERHVEWVDDDLESTYVPVMLHDGERRVLDVDPPLGPCAVITNAGDRIAWPDGDRTSVTDLDLDEIASTPSLRPLAWSPDGRRLAGIAYDELWIFDVERGTTETLSLPDASAVHWAPTGFRLAVELRCEESDREIRIFDGVAELRREPCGRGWFAAWAPDGEAFAMNVREDDVDGFRVLSAEGTDAGPFIAGHARAFRPTR